MKHTTKGESLADVNEVSRRGQERKKKNVLSESASRVLKPDDEHLTCDGIVEKEEKKRRRNRKKKVEPTSSIDELVSSPLQQHLDSIEDKRPHVSEGNVSDYDPEDNPDPIMDPGTWASSVPEFTDEDYEIFQDKCDITPPKGVQNLYMICQMTA